MQIFASYKNAIVFLQDKLMIYIKNCKLYSFSTNKNIEVKVQFREDAYPYKAIESICV